MVVAGLVVLGSAPVNGRSVAFSRRMLYCSGVSCARHSASVRSIFSGFSAHGALPAFSPFDAGGWAEEARLHSRFGNYVDLDQHIFWQTGDFDRGAGRQRAGTGKVFAIDRVHRGKIVEVLEEDGGFYNLREA